MTIRYLSKSWGWLGALTVLVLAGSMVSIVSIVSNIINAHMPPLIFYPELPIHAENPANPGTVFEGTLHTRAGWTVTFLPVRCIPDDGGTGLGELLLNYSNALVNDEIPSYDPRHKKDLGGGSISGEIGCLQRQSNTNTVPINTRPGIYHFEGIVSASVGSRTTTARWYTVSFIVDP